MGKIITITFEDVVKAIGINPGENEYMVIFKTQAAFYKIDKSKSPEIETLKNSKENGLEVSIVNNALTSEILEVNLT
ncbi:MAG: hypothetical protein K8T10_05895 [Candidatus Eremiobacteraeota bacterium]|nr:hypothetical protein [Candidatus Eremiobacteraeota bacterium]